MKTVKKAIIPAAGLGTRFLPATKAMPKEMLPVVDKPTIQYIVEEAVQSGIEDIIIVTGRNKWSIENHFDKNIELEKKLHETGKNSQLKMMEEITNLADIYYVRQKQTLGLGHAIWCARKFIGNEPFAVLLGDTITDGDVPCLKQLIDVYNEVQKSVIAVQPVPQSDIGKFGIIGGDLIRDRLLKVNQLVEKPSANPPSNLAIIGRYILQPSIFNILGTLEPGVGGEIQLTDALQELAMLSGMYAVLYEGKMYDIGDKLGFLKASVELAAKDPALRDDLLAFILEFCKTQGGGDPS